jgi:hypothetical protein
MVVNTTPNVTEDMVTDWPAIRFLNRVQFLKHKGEVEIFESKQK